MRSIRATLRNVHVSKGGIRVVICDKQVTQKNFFTFLCFACIAGKYHLLFSTNDFKLYYIVNDIDKYVCICALLFSNVVVLCSYPLLLYSERHLL